MVKLFYLLGGIHIQPDSYNYLFCVSHYDYPPGYPLFLRTLTSMLPNLYFVAAVQCLIFAAAGAWFALSVTKTRNAFVWLSVVLAVEPMTAFFANSMMSEALYIPLFLVWLTCWYKAHKREFNWQWVLLLGVLGGLLYGVRFAAIFPATVPVILWLFRKGEWRKLLWRLPLYVLAFQLVLLPVRFHNQKVFGTWQLNELAGATLWNNTAFIYPDSKLIGEAPQNEFEAFLKENWYKYETEPEFSWNSQQIWGNELVYRTYLDTSGYTYEDSWKGHRMAGEIGLRLIIDHPLAYFRGFVAPNMIKSFVFSEYMEAYDTMEQLKDAFNFTDVWRVDYTPYYWIILVLTLGVIGFLALRLRFRDPRFQQWQALLWFIILAMPLVAPVNLRYFYTYGFLVLCMIVVMFLEKEETDPYQPEP